MQNVIIRAEWEKQKHYKTYMASKTATFTIRASTTASTSAVSCI